MRELFLRGGWPASRIFALHHSWDIAAPRGDRPTSDYFLFLGRLIEEKGIRFLVDLWSTPSLRNHRLVVAGEGRLFEELSRREGPKIRWTGFVGGEVKQELIAGCRAMLFPSLWSEPFGTVVYEAYEQSRPVLASSAGGMKEIVFDRKTGRVLPPGDPEGWNRAILELSNDSGTASAWGKAGRDWLEQTVSPAAWLKGFEAILEQSKISEGTPAPGTPRR
jgi:glycosyltransferase involved in cell wall biosynthesis